MKMYVGVISSVILVVGVMVLSDVPFEGPSDAAACACSYTSGTPGGGDFVPQRRDAPDTYFNRPALTKEQAHDVVANHVKKLNPDLKIGRLQDAGSYYEAEVLGANGDVVQRLGVDKESGQMILIN
jgi:hypothetical protein